MKTEKICISKKNLIISLIVVLLLGVVGVSYMVQRNLSIKSKASEMGTTFANCRVAFEEITKPLFSGVYLPQNVVTFEDNYVENSKSNNLVSCASDQKYVYATSNNDWKSVPGKCCLNVISKSDGKSVEEGLASIGLSYIAGVGIDESSTPFIKITDNGKASSIVNTCVNYGVAGNPTRSCGPNVVDKEPCDGGVRIVHVACENKSTPDQPPGNNSCGFTCKTANKNAKGEDIFAYECNKETTCLPVPTEPPAANTFNSTNQTSNQGGAEINVNCSQNLKQQDGSVLKSDYYKCYVAIDLLRGTTINESGDIFPAPTKINNIPVVYENNDANRALPKRVSTFYGQNKNESCKKLVGSTLTNGVCASQK